ncbi:MAG: HAMP domain-containing protein [Spirochaetaceae bacterium]|nr:HAMP domain-containing protein [Spirochaetaceae bacterium]
MGKEKQQKIGQLTIYSANVKQKPERSAIFSIGVKMVTIVTLIVLLSLGSITALVSWLVREDLQILAEENNFETNRRSAVEAEDTLLKMRSDALMIIHTITSVGIHSALAQNNTAYFFKQNPRIAALFFAAPEQTKKFLVNEQFFISRSIDSSLVDLYLNNHQTTLTLASAGETMVLNATPHFKIHLLAMFFPGETGGGMVLFSPEYLSASFGFGVNQSWMINSSGDILLHPNFEHIRSGVNVSDRNFIRNIQESSHRSRQSLINVDFDVMLPDASDKSFFIQTWESLKQKTISLFHTCIDLICRVLRIERNISQYQGVVSDATRKFIAYTKLGIGGCTVITNIEYNKVFEGIAATTRRNIYLTITVLGFSIMFIWFFAKSISAPLKTLAAAARKIEGGVFDIELQKPKSRDEIGILTDSFQKMSSALNIFGRFTNKEIAVKAMRGEIKPGGLSKHATVFFSDIRDFTSKSENFTNVFGEDGSDKIVYWLNQYFSQMIDCVEKTNGIIDKFIGDALMAHWGTAYTSGSSERDAYNCVRAALLMRKALYEMNKARRKGDPSNPPIAIGCGINTGVITAGQLGSDMRMEYTVIGDPVNLASRIESLSKVFGADILISENTWNLVKKYFITEEMPSVTVKGKEKPVRIFAVINFSNIDKGAKTLADVRKLLDIKAPDLANVDVNANEKKYNIGKEKK